MGIDEEFRSLGTLIAPNGTDTADVFQDIEEGFSFYASSSVTDTTVIPLTIITAYEDDALSTTLEIVVEPAPIQITLEFTDGKEVWPTLRERDGGNDNERNVMRFIITVTQNNQPIPDYEIQTSMQFIQGTGGHNHTNNEFPTESLGTLRNTNTEQEGVGMLTTQTGEDGRIEIEYTASAFSGQFEITVESTSHNSSLNGALTVKVPNLLLFQGNGSYQLTGATGAHSDNHYIANQQAMESLLNTANAFAIASWNSTGQMRLNDMSIEWGGIFDITGEWEVPHSSHRTGRNVDIENISSVDTTVVINGNERTIRVFNEDWIRNYRTLMEDRNWRFVNEGQQDPFRENPRLRYPHFNWEGN